MAALAVPAATVLSACAESKSEAAAHGPDSAHQAGDNAPPPAPAPAPGKTPRQIAEEMDAAHERGVKAFPAATEGKGNQLLAPRIVDGVKVFELTAQEIQWEIEPGK